MPNTHSTLAGLFADIANSIRAKTGSNEAIIADNFPSAIDSIPSGADLPEFINKITFGTYTPAEDIQQPQIQHGLGEIPFGVVIWDEDAVSTSTVAEEALNFLMAYFINPEKVQGYDYSLQNIKHRNASGARTNASGYANYVGATVNVFYFGYNSTWYMRANRNYHWIAWC